MNDIAQRYLACWNETDPTTLRGMLADTFSAEAELVDPLVDAHGIDDLAAAITSVQMQFPGFVFSVVGEPESHHHITRMQWGLGPAGAEPVVIGFDVLVTGADERIEFVAGFFDKLVAAA